jgi:hypothetical protein
MNEASRIPEARRYKWLRIRSWQDELVVSYFLRAKFSGRNLFFEAARHVLPPVAAEHRAIDRLPYPTIRGTLGWALRTIMAAPLIAVASLFWLVFKTLRLLSSIFGSRERQVRRQIRTDPQFDFGSEKSVREILAGTQFTNYFQRMDREMYVKVVEQQILDAIVDFLDEHDVDTSEIKSRQSTILNHGIIVQKGDVKAGSLAVGTAAQALGGVFERLGRVAKEAPAK